MKLTATAWFVLLLICSCNFLLGQNNISVNFNEVPFEKMVIQVEQEYPYRFFYKNIWTDSLRVTVQLNNGTIEDLMQRALDGSGLHFIIVHDRNIILSREFVLTPDLPPDFWNNTANPATDTNLEELFAIKEETEEPVVIDDSESRIFEIGIAGSKSTPSIAGFVRAARTGEPLVGVSVFIKEPLIGTLTDEFGYFVLNLPKGQHELNFKYVGKKDTRRNILLQGDGRLDLEMEEEVLALDEIVISGEKSQVESVQTGAVKLNIAEIKSIPTLLGEADVMKLSLTLPGVQTVGEGAAGFHVRGGNIDQNLILLNDAPIYNPNHLFGFFSAFNPNVIKYAELYKSGIQAKYGGRISSVLDIAIRDGNKNKFIAAGGISPITAKVSLEGPMLNQTGTYILGLRSTYANWLLNALESPNLRESRGSFGDLIGKLNYQPNDKNNITVSGYQSLDRFQLNADSLYTYSNSNASLRWRHAFNNRFTSLISAGFTNYNYQLTSDQSLFNAFQLDYAINQTSLKADFDFYPDSRHKLHFGIQSNYYDLNPGRLLPLGDSSILKPIRINRESGLETAIYLGDEFSLGQRLSFYAGIRFSGFAALGPGNIYDYLPDRTREVEFITDSVSYNPGEVIQTYLGPEYRLGARFRLQENLSLKASYDKTRQYIHILTNSIAISPTDTWRLSGKYIRPQIGDQVALGMYQEFRSVGVEISLEGYYKNIQNQLEYKDGAVLIANPYLETDIISGLGKAFGGELLVKKKTGQLTGWLSYTYSRALVQADGPYPEEQINGGKFYPSNFDRPHNLSLITNYKYNRRLNFSFNIAYSTGRPITLPVTQYQLFNNTLVMYSDRNQFRVPDYFRIDFALNIEGNHRVKKFGHTSWSFSIYNLTGRNNAYSVFSRVTEGELQTYQLSIFARPIPTLTFNFEIR